MYSTAYFSLHCLFTQGNIFNTSLFRFVLFIFEFINNICIYLSCKTSCFERNVFCEMTKLTYISHVFAIVLKWEFLKSTFLDFCNKNSLLFLTKSLVIEERFFKDLHLFERYEYMTSLPWELPSSTEKLTKHSRQYYIIITLLDTNFSWEYIFQQNSY